MKKLLLSLIGLAVFTGLNAQSNQIQAVNQTISFGIQAPTKKIKPANKGITTCANDTLDYALAKATGLQSININNATSAQALCQYFNAPQDITIHGVTFHAYKLDATGGTSLNATVELYLAGSDSMPTGAALASTTISVDTSFGGGSLPVLEKNVSFSSPVTVNQPYIIVVGNYSANGMGMICNSWTATPADGAQEWLASIDIGGTWLRSYGVSVGGVPFDSDPLIAPHVSYDLEADFSASPMTFSTAPTVVNFTDNSSPVLQDRMYNQAAFLGVANLSFTYDFGDGSPQTNAINTNNSYGAVQQYTVTLSDTLYGWRTNCVESESKILNANTDLVITEIMYNPPEANTDSLEFIEIYNNGTNAVDVTNFTCTGGNYTFPNTSIAPGAFYVIAVDSVAFNNIYGMPANGQFSNGLSNNGEDIVLKTASGTVVDSVDYDDGGAWPSGSSAGEPDGGGASIILCNDTADNNIGSNWSASTNNIGVMINGLDVLASPFALEACCIPTSSTDTVSACDSLMWIDGITYYANNTTAQHTLNNAGGCDSVVTLNLTINTSPTVTIAAFNPDTVCTTDPAVTLPSASPSGGVYSGTGVSGSMFDPSAAGAGTHTVYYSFTDGNSCSAMDSTKITVETCTGIDAIANLNNVSIYPNPTTKDLNINLGNAYGTVKVDLLNTLGQVITTNNYTNTGNINIEITGNKGVYFVRLSVDNEQIKTIRVLKY